MIERMVRRAHLPVRYSEGFNPRPKLSLPAPRPVGLATKDDCVVFSLTEDRDPAGLVEALNRQAPPGVRLHSATPLPSGPSPQPAAIEYDLPLDPSESQVVNTRLPDLASQDQWLVQRQKHSRKHNPPPPPRTIDLKPLVRLPERVNTVLHFTTIESESVSARPAEVLGLLGLDDPAVAARLVRTAVRMTVPQTRPQMPGESNTG